MRRLSLAVSFLICTSAPLAAQDAPSSAFRQPLAAVAPLPAELRPDAPRERVEQRRISAAHVLKGAGIGAAVGAAAGGLIAHSIYECKSQEFCIFSRREEALMGAAFGGTVGAVFGGVLALLNPPHRAAQPALTITPAREGGLRLEARLSH